MSLRLVSDEDELENGLTGSCLEDLQMISEGLASIDILLNRMNLIESRTRCRDLKDSINQVILEFEDMQIHFPNAV